VKINILLTPLCLMCSFVLHRRLLLFLLCLAADSSLFAYPPYAILKYGAPNKVNGKKLNNTYTVVDSASLAITLTNTTSATFNMPIQYPIVMVNQNIFNTDFLV